VDENRFALVIRLLAALAEEEVEYVLVGGLAMGLHGLVRATEDVDLFVRPSCANVDRLRAALTRVWDDPHIQEIVYEDLSGDYPVVRYGPPDGAFWVDILARLGESFEYADLEAETKMVREVPVRVATPRTLFRMKRDTVRPKDKMDALALTEVFDNLEDD